MNRRPRPARRPRRIELTPRHKRTRNSHKLLYNLRRRRDAEYWLKLIETQGGGSPVIVVLNWSHPRRWRIDEVKLRRKFPFIVGFIPTDALRGDGIEELRQAISTTVQERIA